MKTNEEELRAPSFQDAEESFQKTKNNRAPGVRTELPKYCASEMGKVFYTLISNIWKTENVPQNWEKLV